MFNSVRLRPQQQFQPRLRTQNNNYIRPLIHLVQQQQQQQQPRAGGCFCPPSHINNGSLSNYFSNYYPINSYNWNCMPYYSYNNQSYDHQLSSNTNNRSSSPPTFVPNENSPSPFVCSSEDEILSQSPVPNLSDIEYEDDFLNFDDQTSWEPDLNEFNFNLAFDVFEQVKF